MAYIGAGITRFNTADDLTVTDDAEIKGGLTVDTTTLFVDATNNRVGIGTTSPSNILTLQGSGLTRQVIDARTSASNGETASLQLWSKNSGGTNNYGYIDYDGDGNMEIGSGGGGASAVAMVFDTNGTEAMRIDSSGNLLVGRTSDTNVVGISARADGQIDLRSTANPLIVRRDSGTGNLVIFGVGPTNLGSITTNGSSVAYNTSSDYRLKENVVDMTGAIDRVKQLSPSRFNFIADPDTTVDGFLAHEAQTVVPEAVTGTHDEVDNDGNPVYQGIDQSKLVPLLTGALQEAIARIETLETTQADLVARIEALEAN